MSPSKQKEIQGRSRYISDKMKVRLKDLKDSRFKFYLDGKFRKQIFQRLRIKYKDWRFLAKELGIDTRALFGLRRGWNLVGDKRVVRFIRMETLAKMSELSGFDLDEIQKHITEVEIGNKRENVSFPLVSKLENERLDGVKRSILEYIHFKNYEKRLEKINNPKFKKNKYSVVSFANELKQRISEMKRRGIKPIAKVKNNNVIVEYRVPGRNYRTRAILPKKIIFDETFAKEFGKWMGDRAGGPHKVGVANKVLPFVRDFQMFLINTLQQPQEQVKILLSCKDGFNPPEKLKKPAGEVVICKTQYGDYAYSVIVSNKLLRNFVFDKIENNLFEILYHSPSSVRFAYYAGLLEAEGSINGSISWAFGLNLRKVTNEKILECLKEATELKYLLCLDGFDSIISRKYSKSSLKYDVRIFRNRIQREKELNLFKELTRYIKHPLKHVKAKELIRKIERGGKI